MHLISYSTVSVRNSYESQFHIYTMYSSRVNVIQIVIGLQRHLQGGSQDQEQLFIQIVFGLQRHLQGAVNTNNSFQILKEKCIGILISSSDSCLFLLKPKRMGKKIKIAQHLIFVGFFIVNNFTDLLVFSPCSGEMGKRNGLKVEFQC